MAIFLDTLAKLVPECHHSTYRHCQKAEITQSILTAISLGERGLADAKMPPC